MLDDGLIVAEGTATELKWLVGGGHIRLEFADPCEIEAAAGALSEASRDDDALALEVPSGFVPTETMPAGMRWFAAHQPFTPIMETVRGLLLGTPIGDSAVLAVAWSAGTGLGGYVWAKRLFKRDPTP